MGHAIDDCGNEDIVFTRLGVAEGIMPCLLGDGGLRANLGRLV
jgi:hypothetical protein